MELKFYKCDVCGQIIAIVDETGVPVVCCGEEMKPITANTVDASLEKHVPVYKIENGRLIVRVGALDHPMTEEHYIRWIAVETNHGNQRKCLKPGENPAACFALCEGDKVKAVYAYCSLHGLWKN